MKNKILLTIFTIFFTFLNFNAISQEVTGVDSIYKKELENHTWETDKIILLEDVKEYVLTKFVTRKFAGNLLSFNNQTNVFGSAYTSWCGNDARISLQGTYKFEGKDKISFKGYTIDSKSPDDSLIHEEIEGEKVLFQIIKQNEKFILRKIKNIN